METMLLIIGIIAVVALLLRPATLRTQVIYVPLVAEEARDGLGYLPLIVVGVLALVVIAGMQGCCGGGIVAGAAGAEGKHIRRWVVRVCLVRRCVIAYPDPTVPLPMTFWWGEPKWYLRHLQE